MPTSDQRTRHHAAGTDPDSNHDVERAAEFYEKILGLKLLFKAPPDWRFSIAAECG